MKTIIIGTFEELSLRILPQGNRKQPKRTKRIFSPSDKTEGFVFFRPQVFFDGQRKAKLSGLFIIHDQLSRTMTAYYNKGFKVFCEAIAYKNLDSKIYEHRFNKPPTCTPSNITATMLLGNIKVSLKHGITG